MSDTAQSDTTSKNKRVSKRDFLDASGQVVDKIGEATGARYTLLGTGKEFDIDFSDASMWGPGRPGTMCAIFGYHTKVGNVANTVLNDKDSPGSAEDAGDECEAWLDGLDKGVWREAAEPGTRGPKYDNAILAVVLLELLGEKAKGDADFYEAKLAEKETVKDAAGNATAGPGYRARVVGRDEIKAMYWQEMAKRGQTKPAAAPADSLA